MESINLSILNKIPDPSFNVMLEIQPLAPLSMVNELPGSYYKTLKSPNKKILCGLMENILEWHIDAADRKEIITEVKRIRKKQKLNFPEVRGSGFAPLLFEYFDIILKVLPPIMHFDDYWSKAFRRADAIVHPKGTLNLNYGLISQKRSLQRSEKNTSQVEDKALEIFFKKNKDQYPLYYSSPTSREYIFVNGNYQFKLSMDKILYEALCEKLSSVNLAYLGNSEGWVNVKISEI